MLSKNNQDEVTEITKTYPMHALVSHPCFMIRFVNEQRIKQLLKFIGDVNGRVIADIGCEAGDLLSRLYKRSKPKKMYGIDFSDYALNRAKAVAGEESWDKITDFILSDAENIKLLDEVCDVAISSNVLEHLNDPQKGFNELVRVTRIGGKIIIHLPLENRIIFLKKIISAVNPKLLGNLKIITPGHKHKPDKQFVAGLIQNCPYPVKLADYKVGPKISIIGLYIYVVLERM